jgi:hypothetical protein
MTLLSGAKELVEEVSLKRGRGDGGGNELDG